MKYNPAIHHRRSVRLKGYDYSQPGAYFVTICAKDRECYFGEIRETELSLNSAGDMLKAVWNEIPSYYPNVGIDQFIVMPNHIHGIIIIHPANVGAGPCACPDRNEHGTVGAGPRACPDRNEHGTVGAGPRACPDENKHDKRGQPQGVAPTISLPDVMQRYKSLTTKRYRTGVEEYGWPPFNGGLWQRNYYEHIIRNEKDMDKIRDYIVNNPLNWENDENYILK